VLRLRLRPRRNLRATARAPVRVRDRPVARDLRLQPRFRGLPVARRTLKLAGSAVLFQHHILQLCDSPQTLRLLVRLRPALRGLPPFRLPPPPLHLRLLARNPLPMPRRALTTPPQTPGPDTDAQHAATARARFAPRSPTGTIRPLRASRPTVAHPPASRSAPAPAIAPGGPPSQPQQTLLRQAAASRLADHALHRARHRVRHVVMHPRWVIN
jgi:hypothetical protein